MPRIDLQGASAIVTGGASGIGEASARQLAELGARVVIADLQEERGQAVASEIGGLFVKCDVSSEDDGAAAVAAASEMGPLRALVNSAGIGRAGRTVDRNNDPMPQKDFEFVIKVNLLGTFNMLRLVGGGDGQDRSARRRRPARGDRQHGVGRGLRRADRPGRLLGVEGWCGRA